MRVQNLIFVFIFALICLLVLQGTWLYYTYQLNLNKIRELSSNTFFEAVERELGDRVVELGKKEDRKDLPQNQVTYAFDSKRIEKSGLKSEQYALMQYITTIFDIPFDLAKLDSIYSSMLIEKGLDVKYVLNYQDSLNTTIRTIGQKINKGFETDIIPVLEGSTVQAIVKISPSVIFRNMFGMLIVSLLIFLLIIACLIYEIKMFLTQHHILQLRENFTNALTHDMKTPLATIHTVLDHLNQDALRDVPDVKKQFCTVAIDQVLNLQALVNQILTFAYIEQNKLVLNKQSVDLPQIIQSLIEKFKIKKEKTVEFYFRNDLGETLVHADPFYLSNAISNLIDNAIKYSGESVRIDIETIAGDKQIFIRIKDNGLGISKGDQLKIFERFERGAEIKRKTVTGFGLGLSYVKQVVAAHGGGVALFSAEGVGSEFVITIPVIFTPIECEID